MPTPIGVIFILVSLFCFFRRDDSLFAVVLFSAIFEASSIIAAKTFGIQPYYAVASLFVLQMLYRATQQSMPGQKFRGRKWMYSFAVIGILSAFILPVIFSGTAVYNPYAGIDEGLLLSPPLHLGLANFTQSAYLLLDVLVVLGASRLPSSSWFSRKAYLLSFYVLTGIIFVQFLCSSLGVAFPYFLIQNHGGYGLQPESVGDWATRFPGTFSESSGAGLVLITFTAGFLAEKMKYGRSLIPIVIGVLALLLVRSTSALAALALVFAGLLIANSAFRFPFYIKVRMFKRNVALLAIAILGCAVAIFSPLRDSIISATAGKQETSSYINRMASDAYALHLFIITHGLGVGMGSNRPSSLITSLLSTVGILGFVVFMGMVFCLLKNATGENTWIRWAGFALIVTMSFGGPDMTMPWLWILLAFAVYLGRDSGNRSEQQQEINEISHSYG
jgi:hypothetical protein